MKYTWKKAGFFLLLAGILGGSTIVWSAFRDSVSVRNRIVLGDINIRLSEKELKDGREIPYQDPKLIFPGDTVSKIPMVTNLAEDCWIRARIQYREDAKGLEGFSDENLEGFSADWVKQGDYFYYKKILETGESVDLFHSVKVPAEWTEEHEDQKLEIDIQADAIQAANFTPDFEALSPWGNQPVELCIHEENGKAVSRKEHTENLVEFHGASHKLLAVPDDFFSDFGTAMPGDLLSGYAQVSNTTKKSSELFFHTEAAAGDELHETLLQKLELTVSMNGENLYQGPLRAEPLSKEISLIKLKPGQKGQMDFSVKVPEELNNAYALSRTDVKWVFTVQEEETDTDRPGTVTPLDGSEKQISPVRTGDESKGLLWLGILLAAMAAVFFGTVLQKGGKRK